MGPARAGWAAILVACTPTAVLSVNCGGSGAGGGGGNAAGGGTEDAGQISCNGRGGGNEFIISVAPASLELGAVTEGSTSAPAVLTITNVRYPHLDFSPFDISVVGSGASLFSFDAGVCDAGDCQLDVFFHPTMLGDAGAILVISAVGTGACVPLSGVGVAP